MFVEPFPAKFSFPSTPGQESSAPGVEGSLRSWDFLYPHPQESTNLLQGVDPGHGGAAGEREKLELLCSPNWEALGTMEGTGSLEHAWGEQGRGGLCLLCSSRNS